MAQVRQDTQDIDQGNMKIYRTPSFMAHMDKHAPHVKHTRKFRNDRARCGVCQQWVLKETVGSVQ